MFAPVLALAAVLAAAPKSFFKAPAFYRNSDCAGTPVKLDYNFSRLSRYDGAWLNALEHEYLQPWGVNKCLRSLSQRRFVGGDAGREAAVEQISEETGETFVPSPGRNPSVRFNMLRGRCSLGGGVEMEMVYYASSHECRGAALRYNLTAGRCTQTPYGYAKWEHVLTNHTEQCLVERWLQRANAARVTTWRYNSVNCTGGYSIVMRGLLEDYCKGHTCSGCCPTLAIQNRCRAETTPANVARFDQTLQACKRKNDSVVFVQKTLPYQDDKCTVDDHTTELNRTVVEFGKCLNVETPARNFSIRTALQFITTEQHCDLLELGKRNGLFPDFVAYEKLVPQQPQPANGGARAGGAAGAVLLLLAAVVATLL